MYSAWSTSPGHGKAYAEWVAAPAGQLARKPDNITHEEAAAATLAALTAWQALIHYADVQAGQRVLILAAAGGVGHYAVQLAKHLGAYTIGVSSGVNKDFVVSLGADEHIDYTTQRFEETVSQVDLVLDNLGGDSIDRSLKITKKGGTIISIPSALSMEVADKAKAQGINGYSILVQSNADDMGGVAHLLTKGIIKSFVSHVFPFEEMRKAHLQIETGKTKGKVIVTF
jgi:NADPH:quinone reductase-like Zn-dependent oxidoreductase